MCRLTGFLDPAHNPPGDICGRISAMMAVLSHRGPDTEEVWTGEAPNCGRY